MTEHVFLYMENSIRPWIFLGLTVEKGWVHDTSTDGEGKPQLPNGLK